MKQTFSCRKPVTSSSKTGCSNSVIIVLALTVIFNSFMVYRAVKYQRVVLIPPKMTGTVEFVQGKPTDGYIKDISRRIVSLAATYSPPTARTQFEELLSYYAPEAYPEASKAWYSLASRVEESQVSSVFYLEKINLVTTLSRFSEISNSLPGIPCLRTPARPI